MSALQSQLYRQMKKHKMIADGKDAKGFVLNTLNGVVLMLMFALLANLGV